MNETNSPVKRASGTIRAFLESDRFKLQVSRTLPKHLAPERFIRIALTTMMRVPKLAQCDQTSFFNALLTLSQYGLEPDGRRAHLIPFENNQRGVVECQLILDYKGLVELVMRSGAVSNIHADVVRESDEFEFDRGQVLKHRIDFRKPRGAAYAVYCIVKLKDGSEPKCDVMSVSEVNERRDKSPGYVKAMQKGKPHPWITWWDEMAKKTVFKRATKWLDLSPEIHDAIEAIDAETSAVVPGVNVTTTSAAGYGKEAVATMPMELNAVSEPPSEDSKEESDAGLAPASLAGVTAFEESERGPLGTPQGDVAAMVTEAGYTFSQLQKWGSESGVIPGADSLSNFGELPTDVCQRILRAKKGVLAGLAKVKEVAS